MMVDLFTVKQRIMNDPSLSPIQKQKLMADADHAWTFRPGGISVSELAAIGFGALAGYLFGGLTGASTLGRLANSAIGGALGAWAAPRPSHIQGQGYYVF